MTFDPDGIGLAPVHFNALYSVLKMHVLNFMHSFQHLFFISLRRVSAWSGTSSLVSPGRPPPAPREGQMKRRGGLLRLQLPLQPLSALPPSSIRTGSLPRCDWWPQPRPRPGFGECVGQRWRDGWP